MKYLELFTLLLILIAMANTVSAQESYTFKVSTGQNIAYEVLVFEHTSAGFVLKTPISLNSYDSSSNQLVWEVTQAAEGNSFKAQRNGNTIKLQGTFKRQPVSKEYTIDSRPWYQYPEVTLQKFALSMKQRVEFWIISPNDLALFEFEALKMNIEKVKISGRSIKAVRIRIKALGFAGNFWHADYWFALADGRYIRYQAVHGGPGTPPTIKELISLCTD